MKIIFQIVADEYYELVFNTRKDAVKCARTLMKATNLTSVCVKVNGEYFNLNSQRGHEYFGIKY